MDLLLKKMCKYKTNLDYFCFMLGTQFHKRKFRTFQDIFTLFSGHQREKNKDISGQFSRNGLEDTEAKISGHYIKSGKKHFSIPKLMSKQNLLPWLKKILNFTPRKCT